MPNQYHVLQSYRLVGSYGPTTTMVCSQILWISLKTSKLLWLESIGDWKRRSSTFGRNIRRARWKNTGYASCWWQFVCELEIIFQVISHKIFHFKEAIDVINKAIKAKRSAFESEVDQHEKRLKSWNGESKECKFCNLSSFSVFQELKCFLVATKFARRGQWNCCAILLNEILVKVWNKIVDILERFEFQRTHFFSRPLRFGSSSNFRLRFFHASHDNGIGSRYCEYNDSSSKLIELSSLKSEDWKFRVQNY